MMPFGIAGLGLWLLATRAVWAEWIGDTMQGWLPLASLTLRSLVWICVTWAIVRLVDQVVRSRIQKRSGRPAPRLLRELIGVGLVLVSASALAIVVFGAPPTTALTTSGVLVAVIGFAVRSMIADLFYGVTLALERPFDIGDWVGIAAGSAEEKLGRVEEFTWRSVKLLTRENYRVVVPNSLIATNPVVNYDRPDPAWRDTLQITLGYDVQPEEVRRLFFAAVQQVPEMRAIQREPEARVLSYRPEGIVWELRFWVPSYAESTRVAQRLHEALLRGLRFAGISVPRPREETLVRPLVEEHAREQEVARRWIDRVPIFAPIPEGERQELQSKARRIELPRGAEVVRRGEVGDSLFVIHEGALEVRVGDPEAPAVAFMGPGDVFGEMSLLTGAERSATVTTGSPSVVSQITKADVHPLLQQHPELVREFAAIVEERVQADAERLSERADAEESVESRRQQFADRVRAWFRLPGVRPLRTDERLAVQGHGREGSNAGRFQGGG
jgi:small-conductance mechanosensitive channel/CRP-like cAMP-binding protein